MDYTSAPPRRIVKPLRNIIGVAHDQIEPLTHGDLRDRLSLVCSKIRIRIESESAIPDDLRAELWQLNREMTRRGIPPSLRGLPDPSDDDADQIADRVAIDAEWLVAKYPDHKTKARRMQYLWRPDNFHSQVEFISLSYPKREGWWFVRCLALTDAQDREMHFLRRHGTWRLFEQTEREKEGIRIQLAMHYHKTAKDPRHRSNSPAETVARRLVVWELGTLFGWESPSEIAKLYSATTGTPIARNLVAKLRDQVAAALPETSNKIDKARGKRV